MYVYAIFCQLALSLLIYLIPCHRELTDSNPIRLFSIACFLTIAHLINLVLLFRFLRSRANLRILRTSAFLTTALIGMAFAPYLPYASNAALLLAIAAVGAGIYYKNLLTRSLLTRRSIR